MVSSQKSIIPGHKTYLNKCKNIELIPCILPNHHRLMLVFNSNKNKRKPIYLWKLNNALLIDSFVKKNKEIKDFLIFNENEDTNIQTYGMQ